MCLRIFYFADTQYQSAVINVVFHSYDYSGVATETAQGACASLTPIRPDHANYQYIQRKGRKKTHGQVQRQAAVPLSESAELQFSGEILQYDKKKLLQP